MVILVKINRHTWKNWGGRGVKCLCLYVPQASKIRVAKVSVFQLIRGHSNVESSDGDPDGELYRCLQAKIT
jgi:hypothetical protein